MRDKKRVEPRFIWWPAIATIAGICVLASLKLYQAYRNDGQDEAPMTHYLRVQDMRENSLCPEEAKAALEDGHLTYAESLAVFRCHNRKDLGF